MIIEVQDQRSNPHQSVAAVAVPVEAEADMTSEAVFHYAASFDRSGRHSEHLDQHGQAFRQSI
ncbi:MAG: hypothetical protein AAGE80_11135 [Pseudomonadota bacterium]